MVRLKSYLYVPRNLNGFFVPDLMDIPNPRPKPHAVISVIV